MEDENVRMQAVQLTRTTGSASSKHGGSKKNICERRNLLQLLSWLWAFRFTFLGMNLGRSMNKTEKKKNDNL